MRWCDGCKKPTKQKFIVGRDGNNTYKCTICGLRNYTIQGFNMNLM